MNDPKPPKRNQPSDPATVDLTAAELSVMDALLSEAIGRQDPPVLTDSIMARSRVESIPTNPSIVTVERSKKRDLVSEPASRSPWATAALTCLAMVASIMAIVWLRPMISLSTPNLTNNEVSSANTNRDGIKTIAEAPPIEIASATIGTTSPQDSPSQSLQKSIAKNRDLDPMPIALQPIESPETGERDWRDEDASKNAVRSTVALAPSEPITLVSSKIAADFDQFWRSANVQPTGEAELNEVAERFSVVLGVKVPAEVITDHESLSQWLARKEVAKAVSESWWNQVTGGNFDQVGSQVGQSLRDAVAKCFESSSPIDGLLVDLISGKSDWSSGFFASLKPRNSNSTHPDLIANLASLSMNMDVRCTRCHDEFVGGNQSQGSYWNFAALVRQAVPVADGARGNDPLFFELPDRRQKLAQPGVPANWIGDPSTSEIDSLDRWAHALEGSRPLAAGVVNSLWKLIHGRPLSGQVSHPMSAPMSDGLMGIEDDLIDDLMRSKFDINRTLTMILMSPSTRRTVPDSLRDVWATDQSEAHRQTIAFAGLIPASSPLPLAIKLDQSMRSIGAMLPGDAPSSLAQFGPSATVGAQRAGQDSLSWDFPDHAESPPVRWLGTIDSTEEKIRHLGYLAGHDRLPPSIESAAKTMQKTDLNEATVLHRIWWLTQ